MPEERKCVSYTLVQSNHCWCAVHFIATAKSRVTASNVKLENGTGSGHCLLTVLSVTQRTECQYIQLTGQDTVPVYCQVLSRM